MLAAYRHLSASLMLEVQQLTIVQNGQRLWDSVSFQVSAGERKVFLPPVAMAKPPWAVFWRNGKTQPLAG